MSANSRKDPLTTFLFGFKITSGPENLKLDYKESTAFFKSVAGLKSETDVTDLNEGGVSAFSRKLISVTKWPNLVLAQGFTGDANLFNWKYKPARVNGSIYQLGPKMQVICQWDFIGGYPVKWTGPEFDANKNEMAIETIEIAHHGLFMKLPGAEPPPAPPPAPPPPSPPVDATVNFGSDSSTVKSPNANLDGIAKRVKDDPEKKVKIQGHTDSDGAHSYNVSLSQKRADEVKKYLIEQGVEESKISQCKGWGPDKPISGTANAGEQKSRQRRTTIKDADAPEDY